MGKVLKANVILCDIEGTTTSIDFVKKILFPYSQKECLSFLQENWDDAIVKKIVSEIISETNLAGKDKNDSIKIVNDAVNEMIEKDMKFGPLKALQGLIWERGYLNGNLKGHIYEDVPDAFRRWTKNGVKIYIYSSGSVKAQKLLFGSSEAGDLLPLLKGHFDTAVGAKQEVSSYRKITEELQTSPEEIVFFTDVPGEAYAARDAGIKTIILDRPGNVPLLEKDKSEFEIIKSFKELDVITVS